MWFSPGIVLAGIIVWIVYEVTGTATHWWLWLVAILVSLTLDAILGWGSREVPKIKTRSEYYKK